MYWTDQTRRLQTKDRGHSGKGETWGGAVLLLPWVLLVGRWRLWTRFHQKMSCRMGANSMSSCRFSPHAHFPTPLQNLQFVYQEHHSPCKWNLGPKFIWYIFIHHLQRNDGVMFGSVPLDVRCDVKHQGPSQRTRSPAEDVAWRSGEGTPPPSTQMA